MKIFLAKPIITFLIVLLSSFGTANTYGWTNPTALKTFTLFNLPTNDVSVAVTENGDSIAVWINDSNYAVQYATRKAGHWTAAKNLYTPSATKNETASNARVVIKPDGTALAIFSATIPGKLQYCVYGNRVIRCLGPSTSTAKIATLVPGATSWTKTNLSAPGILVSDTQIGLDQAGNTVASWTYLEKAGTQPALQIATLPLNGTWPTPQTLYSFANSLSLLNLSV